MCMEEHALAILEQKDLKWPVTRRILDTEEQGGKYKVPTAKLLYHLILESQKFHGQVLDRFWEQVGACNEKLNENIQRLREEHFVSAEKSFEVLFRGLDPQNVNFDPVLDMAAEYFTHLGIAFMSLGGRKSGTSIEFSVSEAVSGETDELLQQVKAGGGFGQRHQEVLKALSFKRDGNTCLLTATKFVPSDEPGIRPTLAHIIPNSLHEKPEALKCIAMFAGAAVRDDVVRHLNDIGNAMNMQHDVHTLYDELYWGIEAKEEAGEVKYFFRTVPTNRYSNLGHITLKEGNEIQFGKGPDGKKLDNGPIPRLCNLRLAVARVMRMGGAI